MTATSTPRCDRCGARLATDNHAGRCTPCQAADRARVTHAPTVPPDFWTDTSLQEALSARHMGQVIRAYRRHPYHGRQPLSQEIVAGWVGITQAQLSRIENGGPIVHLDRLTHWAKILGIPETYLWFALPNDCSQGGESEDVKRRRVLTAAGAGLVGALAGWAARPPVASPPSSGLAAAMLNSVPLTTEPASITELTKQVTAAWHLRQRANYDALGQLLPTLVTQAEARTAVNDERPSKPAGLSSMSTTPPAPCCASSAMIPSHLSLPTGPSVPPAPSTIPSSLPPPCTASQMSCSVRAERTRPKPWRCKRRTSWSQANSRPRAALRCGAACS